MLSSHKNEKANDLVDWTDAISTHLHRLLDILQQANETNLRGAGELHQQQEILSSFRIAPELMSRYFGNPESDFGILHKLYFTVSQKLELASGYDWIIRDRS
jgi:hypothetical protein